MLTWPFLNRNAGGENVEGLNGDTIEILNAFANQAASLDVLTNNPEAVSHNCSFVLYLAGW